MSQRPQWDDQFVETHEEASERWQERRNRRRSEGKCWQCAALIADCRCPNVTHAKSEPPQ